MNTKVQLTTDFEVIKTDELARIKSNKVVDSHKAILKDAIYLHYRDEYLEAQKMIRLYEEQRDKAQLAILQAMGTACMAILKDGSMFIRKLVERNAEKKVREAYSYVDFKYKIV